MDKTKRPIIESDLPVIEHEGALERSLPVICIKHESKHMSFSTAEYNGTSEMMERKDGVGYDPKTGILYQTENFRK